MLFLRGFASIKCTDPINISVVTQHKSIGIHKCNTLIISIFCKANPPIKTHEDGALKIKVWRNKSQDGKPIYNATISIAYLHKETGEWRETRSLSADDLLKAQPLMAEAYHTNTH